MATAQAWKVLNTDPGGDGGVTLCDPDGPLLDDEWAVKLLPETYCG